MMDVHISIEAHIFFKPRVLPTTHILVVGNVLKDNRIQGLLKT